MSEKTQREAMDGVHSEIRQQIGANKGGKYIFRGETKEYEEVSSTLYRAYKNILHSGDIANDAEYPLTVDELLQRDLRDPEPYAIEHDDDMIWELMKHYDGETNLIDFSHDYLIALFFACNRYHNQNGRLILCDTHSIDRAKVSVIEPTKPRGRVDAQESVFVSPKSGVLDAEQVKHIPIPARHKRPILNFLRTHHNITTYTIYHDIHGYISRNKIHKMAYTYLYRGYFYYKTGDEQEAIDDLTAAIDINPQMADAYCNRGLVYKEQGEHRKAIADYTMAIKIDPRYADAYYNRAVAYRELLEPENAIASCTKAIKHNPQFILAYFQRGVAYEGLKKYKRAIADYTEAINIYPQFVEAYFKRGVIHETLSEYRQAIKDYTEVIKIRPRTADAHRSRASCYNELALEEHNEEKRHIFYTHVLEDCCVVLECHPDSLVDYPVLFSYYQVFCRRARERSDAEEQQVREILAPIVNRVLRLAEAQEPDTLIKELERMFGDIGAKPSKSTSTDE